MGDSVKGFYTVTFWFFMIACFSFIAFCRGMNLGTEQMQDECYKRGVAIHHPQTGAFTWKEK